jgi:putative nucleotidyltransferase with HDIG domain
MSNLREFLLEKIPEFNKIQDVDLKEKTMQAYEMAIEMGKWGIEELEKLPFTLLIKTEGMTLINHIRSVTQMSIKVAEVFNSFYDKKLNMDHIASGALLHDVGKFVEYEKKNGEIVVSKDGRLLRHPFSGAAIAFKVGIPTDIINIIALHSKEGEKNKRTAEGIIIHHCDFMNFEPFKE